MCTQILANRKPESCNLTPGQINKNDKESKFHIICLVLLWAQATSIFLRLLPALGCTNRERPGAIWGWEGRRGGGGEKRMRRETRRRGGLQDRCGLRNCQPISRLLADPNPAATHPSALLLLRAGGPAPEQRGAVLQKPIININVHQRDGGRRLPSATPLDLDLPAPDYDVKQCVPERRCSPGRLLIEQHGLNAQYSLGGAAYHYFTWRKAWQDQGMWVICSVEGPFK